MSETELDGPAPSVFGRVVQRLVDVESLHWELAFYGIVLAYTAALVVTSFNYRPAARLFPVFVGTLIVGMTVLKTGLLLLERWRGFTVGDIFGEVQEQFMGYDSENRFDPVEQYARQIQTIGWILALVLLVWLFGFGLAAMLYVFLFVYVYERDLRTATVTAVVTAVLVFVIFVQILSAALWPGVVFI